MIQLDIDPEQLGRNYPNAVSLLGDAKATLRPWWTRRSARRRRRRRRGPARVQQLVAEWRAKAEQMRKSDAVPMRPERICREITEALPADGVVVSDTGHAGMWTGQMMDITKPGQRYIRCEGSLGWGLPGAMGVKCALPDRPVVCFTGDGGLYYHLTELETAARHSINLVVLINNNSSLNQEIPLVKAAYKEKRDEQAPAKCGASRRTRTSPRSRRPSVAPRSASRSPAQLKDLLPQGVRHGQAGRARLHQRGAGAGADGLAAGRGGWAAD